MPDDCNSTKPFWVPNANLRRQVRFKRPPGRPKPLFLYENVTGMPGINYSFAAASRKHPATSPQGLAHVNLIGYLLADRK
jgi:hypothetical protein